MLLNDDDSEHEGSPLYLETISGHHYHTLLWSVHCLTETETRLCCAVRTYRHSFVSAFNSTLTPAINYAKGIFIHRKYDNYYFNFMP